jgi:hypothetical protein
MLNKGPYVVEGVKTLDGILQRMQAHQQEKRSMLRKLGLATGFKDVERGGARYGASSHQQRQPQSADA